MAKFYFLSARGIKKWLGGTQLWRQFPKRSIHPKDLHFFQHWLISIVWLIYWIVQSIASIEFHRIDRLSLIVFDWHTLVIKIQFSITFVLQPKNLVIIVIQNIVKDRWRMQVKVEQWVFCSLRHKESKDIGKKAIPKAANLQNSS